MTFTSEAFDKAYPGKPDRTAAKARSELAAEVRLREEAEAAQAKAERDRDAALARESEATDQLKLLKDKLLADSEAHGSTLTELDQMRGVLSEEKTARAAAESALAESRAGMATIQRNLEAERRAHAATVKTLSAPKADAAMPPLQVVVKRPGKKDATLVVSASEGYAK